MNNRRLSTFVKQLEQRAVRSGEYTRDGQLLERFIEAHDGGAFAELVRRHGPMVLGVSRRIVGNTHDADDAFQATFLVLARRAVTIQPRDQVGNWLYGVACRTARAARTAATRRMKHVRPTSPLPDARLVCFDTSFEALELLDVELERLPDHLRAAVVLCELQGHSRTEASRLLNIPEGTLSSRLAAARKRLANRLIRRG